MKLWLAQIAQRVGDIDANVELIIDALEQAAAADAKLALFPELTITGYPPEDLLLRPAFMQAVERAVARVVSNSSSVCAVFGAPRLVEGRLYNSVYVARHGEVMAIYDKQRLPNYGVFDEQRYFTAGSGQNATFVLDDKRIGLSLCEDLWHDDLALKQAALDCKLWLNLNASPFHADKQVAREALVARRAQQFNAPVAYVNPVGGQDEIVFDGGSHLVSADGELVARAPMFEVWQSAVESEDTEGVVVPLPSTVAQIHSAMVMGVRDYVRRNGCSEVVVGLSGGIDSALTAQVAVDALGSEQVLGVLLPSKFSSDHSISDAEALAQNLGIETITLPIADPVMAVERSLTPIFAAWGKAGQDVTEENIQARMRGLLLMAISNKTGRMLLTTGNKSEMAVGYATLYGDMAGGFAVLKDLYKTEVFEICRWLNREGEVIPWNTINKPPSAELAPDQKDSDSLPDYEVLDAILKATIEERCSVVEIAARGFDRSEVDRVVRLLQFAEYKRRQAPPGVKITERAFGRDRRYPITHHFYDWQQQEGS